MDLPTNLGTPGAPQQPRCNECSARDLGCRASSGSARGEPSRRRHGARSRSGRPGVSFKLRYRLDPERDADDVAMLDDGTGGDAVAGDGLFSATIPGQPNGTLVAFHVQATDTFSPAATSTFPIRCADARMPGALW